MQTNRYSRPRRVQSAQPANAYARYMKKDARPFLILLAALCLLLPPAGIILVWRARETDIKTRLLLSGVGFLSSLLIFCFILRPSGEVSSILPIPVTPQQAGYGPASVQQTVADTAPPAAEAPAQPEIVITMTTADPNLTQQEPETLTDDSIVYAVTNNASSYHLYQICDQQENHRALTLREALNEGLIPCEKCVGAVG